MGGSGGAGGRGGGGGGGGAFIGFCLFWGVGCGGKGGGVEGNSGTGDDESKHKQQLKF